jgi:SpoVK/Ycf46/Vps4 family AAA+-type ATPase
MKSNSIMQMQPGKNLDELKLNNETQEQVKEIIAACKLQQTVKAKRGLGKEIKPGMAVLFYGPPGTGKSLAAAVIGKETGTPVYRVNLPGIVSKYIGETEKNLELLFKKAAAEKAVLFFDEADALFGKRSGVKDAHDRYANQEVSYLLQQIEDHNGLVILASNMKANIDPAFIRRLRYVVKF